MSMQSMRRQYIKPEIDVIDCAPCVLMASSVVFDDSSQGDFSEDFVKGHRGTWGDHWGESN